MKLLLLTKLEIVLIVVLSVFVVSAILNIFTGRTLSNIIFRRNNPIGRGIARKFQRMAKRYKINYSWWNNFPNEILNITSADGLQLYGRILRQKEKTNLLAIVVHGFMSNYKDMQTFVKYFYDKGFNVLAVDNRAHGMSEGEYVGMGWLDKDDLELWIKKCIEEFGKRVKIILFGVSMGGATVCMTAGKNLPSNVKGIISDSAFDSVYNILAHVFKSELKITGFPLFKTFEAYHKIFWGASLKEQSAIEQVKKSKVPILYIHGEGDDFVPFEMVKNLYDATKPELRDIYTVPNAWHIEAQAKNPKKYNKKLDEWLEKHVL